MDTKTEEEAFWARLRRDLARAPSAEELAAWRELARQADDVRVKVDFSVVDQLRRLRGGWAD